MDLIVEGKDRWGIIAGLDPGNIDFIASGRGRCGELEGAGLSPAPWLLLEPT